MFYIKTKLLILFFTYFIYTNCHLRGPVEQQHLLNIDIVEIEEKSNKDNCPDINSTIINEIAIHKIFNYLTKINRDEIILRAQKWKSNKVKLIKNNTYEGYNTDNSGFISMAWKLPSPGFNTRRLSYFCTMNNKSDLRKGDAFFNNENNNSFLFNNWINPFSFNAYSERINKYIDLTTKNYSKLMSSNYFHCKYNNAV